MRLRQHRARAHGQPANREAIAVKGGFLACALWLNRSDPPGDAVLVNRSPSSAAAVPGSAAPFTRLVALGDKALFAPIAPPGISLREAFMNWVYDAEKL